MTEPSLSSDLSTIPEAETAPKSRWSFQLVWLVPLVAALIGGWLAVTSYLDQGPVITIVFKSAEGLEAGKTKVKYKDVEIGKISKVALSQDIKQVIATAELVKDFKPYLADDTTFWLVTPRISGGSVSGLSTILSGTFVGVGVGKSTQALRTFVALDTPPIIQFDTPGREFALHTGDLGSLTTGSPVFFRRVQVGQVVTFKLDEKGQGLNLRVFINAPYDQFITDNTRFWNASGVDIKLDATGIQINTQSLISILVGGIAFETPIEAVERPAAAPNTLFELFSGRTQAVHNPEHDVMKMVLLFGESLRGLTVGAPVDFQGIEIGEVSDIRVELDAKTRRLVMPVEINLYPERLRVRSNEKNSAKPTGEERKRNLETLVAHGLRGQMRTANLLTGQLYIALDFFPDEAKASIDWSGGLPKLPTVSGSMQELQASLKNIANSLEKVPFEKIGTDLSHTLQAASSLLNTLNVKVTPEVTATLAEARQAVEVAKEMLTANKPLLLDSRETIQELGRTAKSLRSLADFLERHPETLIRGKKGDQ